MLFLQSKPEKTYKNYGLLNITQNDLSSIPLSLYNPVSYLKRRELGYHYISKLQPLSLRFLLNSFVSTDNDIYKCNDEEQLAIIPPFACRYNNGKDHRKFLAIADEIGNVRIINTEKEGEIELKTQWLAHENAIFDIAWSLDDKKLITAGGDQTALLWDIETNKCLSGFQGHSSSIKSIVFHNENPFICASGAREGNIMIWDLRCTGTVNENGDYIHKPANIIRNAHVPLSNNSLRKKKDKTNQHIGVAAVHFLHKPGYLASAGTADGLIKFWDIRNNGSYLHRFNPVPAEVSIHSNHSKRPHGFSSLSLDTTGRYLFSACTDNSIYMYNTLNLGKPVCRFTSPTYKCSTFYIKTSISPDNRFIASGSSDNHVYIWDITSPHRSPVKLKGHENEVTAVSWCPIDIKQLVTCSDDTSIRIWNMNQELEEKCKNDLFLKATWGHAVEDIPIETPEDTTSTQVNKENINSSNNTFSDSVNSPTTSFFNFPNTISYSYDSNDSNYSSSPLSRFKYQNNAILLEDEASSSSTPPISYINNNRPSTSSSSSALFSNLTNSQNNMSRSYPSSFNTTNPFLFPSTPTKDVTTPSKIMNDSPLSSSITDYFSTLSTTSPMPSIPPPRITNSNSKRKQSEIPLSFLKSNESSVSFIMPTEKSSSSSPISRKVFSSITRSKSTPTSSNITKVLPTSPKISKIRLTSPFKRSSGLYNQPTLQQSFASASSSNSSSSSSSTSSTSSSTSSSTIASTSSSTSELASTSTLTSKSVSKSPSISKLELALTSTSTSTLKSSSSSSSNLNIPISTTFYASSSSSSSSSSSLSSTAVVSATSSASVSPSQSTSSSTTLPIASTFSSSLASSSTIGSPSINIVSPLSSPCTSVPTSPVLPKRKRTLMDYFSPNTNTTKKNKKKKAKVIDSSEDDTESDEL